MTGSLRGRLLLWYTAMLTVVIVVFGAIVCYIAWRARLADIDESLRSRAEALGRGLQPVTRDTFDLTLPNNLTPDPPYHVVWTPGGAVIDQSDPELHVERPGAPGFRTRNGRREFAVDASGALVLVGRPLDDARADIAALAATMAGVGAAAVLASLLGGLYLITRALAPVRRIDETARAMVDGNFEARVRIERADSELGQLARALNEAFDRLHAALERQRRFTADASHELRTPLTVISTELQWALGREREAHEYRSSIEVCRRASTRMEAVVERLLLLARAEALPVESGATPVRLDEMAEAVARDVRPLADARGLDLRLHAAPVTCCGDRTSLAGALTNVVMNAIQYTAAGGQIRIDVRDAGGGAEIVVSDTGIGIAATHLPHVFEPFFRAEPARTRAGGSGLGLTVTRATVRRHGGEIAIASDAGRGTTVTIRLPRDTTNTDAAPAVGDPGEVQA